MTAAVAVWTVLALRWLYVRMRNRWKQASAEIDGLIAEFNAQHPREPSDPRDDPNAGTGACPAHLRAAE
jgi:hypothetical protein